MLTRTYTYQRMTIVISFLGEFVTLESVLFIMGKKIVQQNRGVGEGRGWVGYIHLAIYRLFPSVSKREAFVCYEWCITIQFPRIKIHSVSRYSILSKLSRIDCSLYIDQISHWLIIGCTLNLNHDTSVYFA